MRSVHLPMSWIGIFILFSPDISGRAQSTPASHEAGATRDWRELDPELARNVDEFDLKTYIESLEPATVDEIIKSLEPSPTPEQVLETVQDPSKRPAIPQLPTAIAVDVADQERRIEEYRQQALTEVLEHEQNKLLDQAIILAEQVVAIRESHQGGNRWRDQRGNASTWFELADARKAVVTLRLARAWQGAQRAAAAAAVDLRNRGRASLARGDLAEADSFFTEALAIHLCIGATDHPHVGSSMNNLAVVYKARGKLEAAGLLMRQALEAERLRCADDHPIVAMCINNVATVSKALGDIAASEVLNSHALLVRLRSFPGDHPVIAMSLNNLSAVLRSRGDLAMAEELMRAALSMDRRLSSGDHPDVALDLNNLASILDAMGNFAEAEPLYRDSLAMHRRLYAGDHPGVATCLNNLGTFLHARGDLAGSEWLLHDSLEMYRRIYAGDHQNVASALNNLAAVNMARGNLDSAETGMRSALLMRQRLFAGDHPAVAMSLNTLGDIMEVRGDLVKAELLCRDGLAMRRRLFPEDHPDVSSSLNSLAQILYARGMLAEAKQILSEATEISRRLYTADHPDLASNMSSLATILQATGELTKAKPLFGDALAMSERLRTHIVGDESVRAAFAEKLQLARRSASYASLLARLGHRGESLAVLERGRSRAVLDLLERRGRDLIAEATAEDDGSGSSKLDAAISAEDQARIELTSTESLLGGRSRERKAHASRTDLEESIKTKRLADYDREIAELGKKVESQRQALAQAGGAVLTELRVLFPSAKPLTTEEILSSLNPDELVLSLAWSDDALLTATARRHNGSGVTTGNITVDGKEAMAGLEAQATMIREAIATRPTLSGSDELRSAARALLSAVIPEQIRPSVQTAKRLIVIPDGPLHGIPLEALAALAGDDSVAGLLADKQTVYAPSATMYVDRREVTRENSIAGEISVVVLGDPIFDRKPLPEPDFPQEGVLLAMVAPESNASKAGLSRGDVLLSYEGTKLPNSEALGPAITAVNQEIESGQRKADKPVKVSVWRDGKTQLSTLSPGRMGVRPSGGSPADGLRAMARAERGYEQAAAGISATDQVRLHGGRLAPLPGTKREATAIAKTISGAGGHVLTLLGEQATIGKLSSTAPGKRIIHLATHGLTGSRDRPYDASLALTQPVEPTPDDIGFLTLDELMGSWLGRLKGCDLVVLSACDTGRGVKKGDSVMALPIGFFAAGAPTVIASLWQVNDLSTSILMEDYYANLIEKKMTKASALDEAKRSLRAMTWEELRRRAQMTKAELATYTESRGLGKTVTAAKGKLQGPFAHPYYWAPFVLIGDPE